MSEDRSSADHGASQENSIWRVMKAALFGDTSAESLRAQLEEAIDRHEDDPAPDAKGDLSPIERQMVRNLLHFGERDAGDVGVPRADIIAVEEQTSFAHLVQIFADAGHSRLPVYREELDTIIGMIHIKDVFAILARGGDWPEGIAELIREMEASLAEAGGIGLAAPQIGVSERVILVSVPAARKRKGPGSDPGAFVFLNPAEPYRTPAMPFLRRGEASSSSTPTPTPVQPMVPKMEP